MTTCSREACASPSGTVLAGAPENCSWPGPRPMASTAGRIASSSGRSTTGVLTCPAAPAARPRRRPARRGARPSRAWTRRVAGHDVVGLLRHRAGDAAAGGEDPLGRLLAREVRQRAGQHERLAAPAGPRPAAAPPARSCTPCARRSSISSRICGSASCVVDQLGHLRARCPASRRSARRRRQQRVDRAEALGEVAAGDEADPSRPMANSTRPNGRSLARLRSRRPGRRADTSP